MSTLEADRLTSEGGRPIADPCAECALAESAGSSSHAGLAGRREPRQAGSAAAVAEGVAEMMLEDGALAVLADVVAPRLPGDAGKESEEARRAAEALPPPAAVVLEAPDDESLRLEALEAAVSMLQARPRAQAEFVRLGGYSRVCRFVHDLAAAGEQGGLRSPAAPSAEPPAAERSRSRSKSRADSLPRGHSRPPAAVAGEHVALDTAFDAMFRLSLDGHAVAAGARADGADMVRTLLVLSARSPSPPVCVRAARSLQALLCVRPMNAVSLERQSGLGIIADAVAGLSFSGGSAEEPWLGADFGLGRGEAVAERLAWSVDDKREALSALNDVVRALAAVYSRQDARALERYAGILLSASTARYGLGASGKPAGTQCSACGATPAGGGFGSATRRCLFEGCRGGAGLCVECDETLHAGSGGDGHVRVPVAARTGCEPRESSCRGAASSPEREDPAWAVEAGKALIKAMMVMLDDRESFGLPPTPERRAGTKRNDAAGATAAAAEHTGRSNAASSVLASMLQIVQDELLEPLHGPRGFTAGDDDGDVQSSNSADSRGNTQGGLSSPNSRTAASTPGWADGWLLGALEVVARLVVRGDGATVEDLGDAGGWGLLAHIARAPLPPRHLSPRHQTPPGVPVAGIDAGRGDQEEEGAQTRTSDGRGRGGECWSWQGGGSEAWTGWVGARRLALWIVREALLTGTAGQLRGSGGGGDAVGTATLLEQPAKWLIWLVRALMKADPSCKDGPAGACSEDQVSCCDSLG